MDFDIVALSRLQFALTALYHFIFVPLTIGLSVILAIMETVYVMTNRPIWRDMTKFWGVLFGINFAMGVATGIVMEFQFGMNWSYYSHYVGDIFGAPLAIEGLMAFFLEATFVGLFFFGWDKLSKRGHLVTTWLVAIGSNFSALWILIANGWMQNPVGAAFNPQTMRMEVTDFGAVLTNPVAQAKFVHTVSAGYTAAAIFVLGISAWYLLKGRHVQLAKRSMTVAASFGLAAALSVVVLGDESGYLSSEHQKMKLAAIEAMWTTEPAPAAFTAFGFPDAKARETHYAVHIPMVMGLIGTRSLTTEIPGIEQLVDRGELLIQDGIKAYDALQTIRSVAPGSPVPQEAKDMFESKGQSMGYALLLKRYVDDPRQATPEQIRKAALDTVPPVAPLFWSFRVMVGLGMFFILLTGTFFILSTRRTLDKHRWLLKLAVFAIPLPWVAIEAGWIVAEVGRQPWVIEGVLPTAVAVSNLGASTLLDHHCRLCRHLHRAVGYRNEAHAQGHPQGAGRERRRPPCQRPQPFILNAPKEGQTMILHEMISYETLRLIWWLLIGILLVGFAITDGFDLGTGILLPFAGKTDLERRVIINSIGPVWEGNQVWLILGGGAIFAAWPQLYAVSFSGFYLAMFVILVALIVRPVAFKFRSKREDPRWRARWDAALFVGGFVPALICGVAIGNVLQGVPFRFSPDMHIFYDGTFFALLNPFALLCGLVSVAMLVMHGATWLQAENGRRRG